MSVEDDEYEVMWDSDEFRACETMAEQKTPIDEAVSRLIDFYGMGNEDGRAYYIEALKAYKSRDEKVVKSKELGEIEAEELEREPSLDQMLDLNDPKVLKGLGELALLAQERQAKLDAQSTQDDPDKTSE